MRVKKKLLILLLLVLLIGIFAMIHIHRIMLIGEGFPISCPRFAFAGSTVTVQTYSVTDGWIDVSCSGAEVKAIREDTFQFVMPNENVQVKVSFVRDEFGA